MKKIYEDENVLAIAKPAGINSDNFEKRAHRLDKDTSGILLIAKNDKTLEFLQEQFKNRKVVKKYIALIVGHLKNKEGIVETLLGRSPQDRRKQKVYLDHGPKAEGKRKAITKYRVLQKFKKYTLIEVEPKTGRKHQIRAHFSYLSHPIAGDKMYGLKNQPIPQGLKRQFLHASYLKIKLPDKELKEFNSILPEELEEILNNLS
ncbi:MAG: RluA family pseudouridine synthase [Candidatus Nealsonbacteria bacterium]|nr:RluA family pseudouridine synthase [Candidatus Nealsonbacteria bacterium]